VRVRTIHRLSEADSAAILKFFRHYREEWNTLVAQDRSGIQLSDSAATADYRQRRALATHPLRKKSWRRVTSIPLSPEIKNYLRGKVSLDWRKVTKPRLLRFGQTIAISYVKLEKREFNLNRDPRLSDAGLCLTNKGLHIRIIGPTDEPIHQFVPTKLLTKQQINELVQQMIGKIQVVGLDPIVPPQMREIKAYLVRKLRNRQAEGAILFRILHRTPLGEKYPNRKLWQRKLMQRFDSYCISMGLTGKPLLVREGEDGRVTGPSDKCVHPIVRANEAIQTVMAKMDLSHSATFLHSRDRQRVQRAFHRQRRKTITTTSRPREQSL
jgi:hypothetical protein